MLLTFVVFVDTADCWRTGGGGAQIDQIKHAGKVLCSDFCTTDSAVAGQIFAECARIDGPGRGPIINSVELLWTRVLATPQPPICYNIFLICLKYLFFICIYLMKMYLF